MKAFLLVLFLSALAIITAIFLHQDAGSVQVSFQGATFSAPLVYVFYGVIGSFVALYILFRLVGMLFRARSNFSNAMNRRSSSSAAQRLVSGTFELTEGQFEKAEKQLIKDVPEGSTGALHYLAAADAAHKQGKPEYRERYLKRAVKRDKRAKFGIDLDQAQESLNTGNGEKALEVSRALLRAKARNSKAMTVLAQSLAATGNWVELNEMLPEMHKFSSFSSQEMEALETKTGAALLASAEDKQLENRWKSLTSKARDQTTLLRTYAERLSASGQGEAAERTLRTALNKNWTPDLVKSYADVEAGSTDQQLTQLQKWIEEHGENADLLAAAGQVSVRQELWGKAHSYLEQAAKLGDSAAIQQALAKIADNKGDAEASRAHLEQGLSLALNS